MSRQQESSQPYTYWAIRPFMLGVTPLFATPNHPSYPAAHGSFSGSISAVLAYLFPHDAAALNALGNEAGESRLWAGIHFRSDIDTGLALGLRGREARDRAGRERWLAMIVN